MNWVCRWFALGTLSLTTLSLAPVASSGVNAAEIRLFNSVALGSIVDALEPQFHKSSGHTLTRTVDVAAVLKRRIDAGEPFDVALLNPGHIDDLMKSGKIVANTRTDFARAGIGVGVRAGSAKPDISTVEAFKRALFNAKLIAHSKEGASGAQFAKMLAEMGIEKEIAPRLRPMDAGLSAQAVAKGEVDMVVVNIAPILAASGVDYVGPVPASLQTWIVFTAGVSSASKQAEAGRAFVQYLATPAAAAVIKAKGMQPPAP